MKVGSIVRCKHTGMIGFIFAKSTYENWRRIYWLKTGEKNQRINHSLTVIHAAQ